MMTPEIVNDSLQQGVIVAENVVKKYVESFRLTQDQFDALVSFVYNRGQSNSEAILTDINQHRFEKGVRAISVFYSYPNNRKCSSH